MSQSWQGENAEKTPIFEKSLPSNACISVTTGLVHSTKSSNRNVTTLGGKLGSKNINPDPALKFWNWGRQKLFYCDKLDSTGYSNSYFFKNTSLSSSFKVLIFSFLLLLRYSFRKSYLLQFKGILSDQSWQKVMLVLTFFEKQSQTSSTVPPSFSLQSIIREFFTWKRLFIRENYENDVVSRIGSLITQLWQNFC